MMIGEGVPTLWIYRKIFRGNKFLFILTVFGFSCLLPMGLAALGGRAVSGEVIGQGYLDDPAALFGLGILGLPFMLGLLALYSERIAAYMSRNIAAETILIAPDIYRGIAEKALSRYNAPWIRLLWIPALLANLGWLYPHLTDPKITWFTALAAGREVLHPLGYYYIILMTFYYYHIALFVAYFAITTSYLGEISKKAERIRINPLHPDRCGGLGGIGKLALFNTFPVLIVGFGIVTIFISDSYYMNYPILALHHVVPTALYLALSPLLFFLPLQSFQRPMKNAKYEILSSLSMKYNDVYQEIFGSASGSDKDMERLDRLEKISNLYGQAGKMPVWPFNLQMIRKVFLTILSPFAALILPPIFEYAVGLILK
jgi:hypothetical protein